MSDTFDVPENPYTSQDVYVYSDTVKFLPSTVVSACESSSNAAGSPTVVELPRAIEQILLSLDWMDEMNEVPSRC